jgi:hypothetical protein
MEHDARRADRKRKLSVVKGSASRQHDLLNLMCPVS